MDIFVYMDESGMLEPTTHDRFVVGGLLFIGKDDRIAFTAKFRKAERDMGLSIREPKWSNLDAEQQKKLLEVINDSREALKFAAETNPREILPEIFEVKGGKTEFLKHMYVEAVSSVLECVAGIDFDSIEFIHIGQDEHTVFNEPVRKDIQDRLLKRYGRPKFNDDFTSYQRPKFPMLNGVTMQTCESDKVPVIRAADIVAGAVYDGKEVDLSAEVKL